MNCVHVARTIAMMPPFERFVCVICASWIPPCFVSSCDRSPYSSPLLTRGKSMLCAMAVVMRVGDIFHAFCLRRDLVNTKGELVFSIARHLIKNMIHLSWALTASV
jgi:hypothetical protein